MVPRYSRRKRGRPPKGDQSSADENMESPRQNSKKLPTICQESLNTTYRATIRTNTTTLRSSSIHNTTNYSAPVNERRQKQYKHLYYINTDTTMNRIHLANAWISLQPRTKDIILQTSKGFLLKSDSEKIRLAKSLDQLIHDKIISSYSETAPHLMKPTTNTPSATFSAVVATVERALDDVSISKALTEQGITHRYCKRIISKATGKPTTLIRIISACENSFQKLMNEGLFFLNKHYPTYPSSRPEPAPLPCSKCQKFTHTSEKCPNNITCEKCNGAHKTISCSTDSQTKCLACKATDHAAWSFKCPLRPKKTIDGIPNIPIKSINKKTAEIDQSTIKNSIIHAAISIHDHIINSSINKLNKPKNSNREELLAKLKKRFITEFKIDTTAVFSGNILYVLMFDLENPEAPSPTEMDTGKSHVTNNG